MMEVEFHTDAVTDRDVVDNQSIVIMWREYLDFVVKMGYEYFAAYRIYALACCIVHL